MDFRQYIQAIPHFPKPNIMYWDFTPLLLHSTAFAAAIQAIQDHYQNQAITKIAAIEAKGFVIGSVLAYNLKVPLVLIRKPGLTPGITRKEKFIKEYGQGEYELKENNVVAEDKVLIVYDILAGMGATQAAIELVQFTGAKVIGCSYIIELEYLHGREALKDYDIFSLVKINQDPLTKV